MLVPGYPDGVEPIDLVKDLRRVKTTPKVRAIVLHLDVEYKQRNLTLEESKWLRDAARRYIKRIRELHAAMDLARVTDARQRMGYRAFNEVASEAKEQTRRNRLRKLRDAKRDLAAAQKEEKDFGI